MARIPPVYSKSGLFQSLENTDQRNEGIIEILIFKSIFSSPFGTFATVKKQCGGPNSTSTTTAAATTNTAAGASSSSSTTTTTNANSNTNGNGNKSSQQRWGMCFAGAPFPRIMLLNKSKNCTIVVDYVAFESTETHPSANTPLLSFRMSNNDTSYSVLESVTCQPSSHVELRLLVGAGSPTNSTIVGGPQSGKRKGSALVTSSSDADSDKLSTASSSADVTADKKGGAIVRINQALTYNVRIHFSVINHETSISYSTVESIGPLHCDSIQNNQKHFVKSIKAKTRLRKCEYIELILLLSDITHGLRRPALPPLDVRDSVRPKAKGKRQDDDEDLRLLDDSDCRTRMLNNCLSLVKPFYGEVIRMDYINKLVMLIQDRNKNVDSASESYRGSNAEETRIAAHSRDGSSRSKNDNENGAEDDNNDVDIEEDEEGENDEHGEPENTTRPINTKRKHTEPSGKELSSKRQRRRRNLSSEGPKARVRDVRREMSNSGNDQSSVQHSPLITGVNKFSPLGPQGSSSPPSIPDADEDFFFDDEWESDPTGASGDETQYDPTSAVLQPLNLTSPDQRVIAEKVIRMLRRQLEREERIKFLRMLFQIEVTENAFESWRLRNNTSSEFVEGSDVRLFHWWLSTDTTGKRYSDSYQRYIQALSDIRRQRTSPVLTIDDNAIINHRIQLLLRSQDFEQKCRDMVRIFTDGGTFCSYFFEEFTPALETHHKRLQLQGLSTEHVMATLADQLRAPQHLLVRLIITKSRFTPEVEQDDAHAATTTHTCAAVDSGRLPEWLSSFMPNHVVLQIGPYMIDWGNSELVWPHPCRNSNSVVALLPVTILDLTRELAHKLAECIFKWNGSDFSNPLDCKFFLCHLLECLNLTIRWQPGGPVAKYIEHMLGKEPNSDPLTFLTVFDPTGQRHDLIDLWQLDTLREQFSSYTSSIQCRDEALTLLDAAQQLLMFRTFNRSRQQMPSTLLTTTTSATWQREPILLQPGIVKSEPTEPSTSLVLSAASRLIANLSHGDNHFVDQYFSGDDQVSVSPIEFPSSPYASTSAPLSPMMRKFSHDDANADGSTANIDALINSFE